jgi:hypothetical protein
MNENENWNVRGKQKRRKEETLNSSRLPSKLDVAMLCVASSSLRLALPCAPIFNSPLSLAKTDGFERKKGNQICATEKDEIQLASLSFSSACSSCCPTQATENRTRTDWGLMSSVGNTPAAIVVGQQLSL